MVADQSTHTTRENVPQYHVWQTYTRVNNACRGPDGKTTPGPSHHGKVGTDITQWVNIEGKLAGGRKAGLGIWTS